MLCFYFRIVPPSDGWRWNVLKSNCYICGVTFIVAILTLFLRCRPFHHLWQVNPDPGSMFDLPAGGTAITFLTRSMHLLYT